MEYRLKYEGHKNRKAAAALQEKLLQHDKHMKELDLHPNYYSSLYLAVICLNCGDNACDMPSVGVLPEEWESSGAEKTVPVEVAHDALASYLANLVKTGCSAVRMLQALSLQSKQISFKIQAAIMIAVNPVGYLTLVNNLKLFISVPKAQCTTILAAGIKGTAPRAQSVSGTQERSDQP